MLNELKIIEKKIDYLLSIRSNSKIKEWLANDITLTQITAERYLLDSLRSKNNNLHERLTGGGVDADLDFKNYKIGVEVTTVNQSTPEWILREKLLMFLEFNNFSRPDVIEITYDLKKIEGLKYTLDLIEIIGDRIIQGQYGKAGNVTIKKIADEGSYISWNNSSSNTNFFDAIKSSLNQILINKSKQLRTNKHNLLFVGVNQLPINVINPSVFRDLTSKSPVHPEWRIELQKIVTATLPKHILGVCFFVYTLPSEDMMYPLKILWRDPKINVPIAV